MNGWAVLPVLRDNVSGRSLGHFVVLERLGLGIGGHITNTSPYSNICSLGTAYLPGFLRHTTTNLRAIHDQQGYAFPSSCNFQAYLITRHAPSWLRVSSWLPREIDSDTGWERDLPIPFLISEHNTHVDPVPASL